jgi:hypothetical protein
LEPQAAKVLLCKSVLAGFMAPAFQVCMHVFVHLVY